MTRWAAARRLLRRSRGSRDWVRCGRSDVIADPSKSSKFYDGVLAPLLNISKDLRSAIFAWDLFNEPEWVTTGWHPYGLRDLPVPDQRMREFLVGAIGRVQNADFKTTIGFLRIETIRRSNCPAATTSSITTLTKRNAAATHPQREARNRRRVRNQPRKEQLARTRGTNR